MTYQNQYGPPGYMPVSSKSGILVVALLTTLAALIGIGAAFLLTYIEDPVTTYTYYEFINEAESLKTDAMIIGGGLLLAVFCAWLIYAVPRGVGATILRVIFVIAGICAALISILAVFVAGVEDGPSFMDIVNASEDTNWGLGAWTILGASVFVFCLSIVMIFVVMQHRRAVQRNASYGAAMDPRMNPNMPQQPNTDPHTWNGHR